MALLAQYVVANITIMSREIYCPTQTLTLAKFIRYIKVILIKVINMICGKQTQYLL